MHGSGAMSATVQMGLGFFYLFVALMNGCLAFYYVRKGPNRSAIIWTVVTLVFWLHATFYLADMGPSLPSSFTDWTTYVMGMWSGQMGPILYTVGSVVVFVALIRYRKWFADPINAFILLNLSLLFAGWSMTNSSFRDIVTKADNVPIVMLIYSVGFCTWLAFRQAVVNDERMDKGEPPMEKLEDEKVLVWPDLVYTELIAMVICTAILVVWAIALKAPLEQPATSAKAPNPSKAPWYFLGLQEMLVYFDPWMAGIVLPLMIIVGLIAIPYIDFNQKGNGYYTYAQRPFAINVFLFGFLVLWVVLIVLGTFLRGPNWNFFGPYEYWDPHKVLPLNNINLSDMWWLGLFDRDPASFGTNWLAREWPGILLVLAYLLVLPPLLARTVMRPFFIKMGFIRFFVLVTLLQFMASLPIKMILRWLFNLKYIVYIPELFFNI
jgi:hypothetical protein